MKTVRHGIFDENYRPETIVTLQDGAGVNFDEGWRVEVKQRVGGSSAGTSDAVSWQLVTCS